MVVLLLETAASEKEVAVQEVVDVIVIQVWEVIAYISNYSDNIIVEQVVIVTKKSTLVASVSNCRCNLNSRNMRWYL